jgi:hypothetical protein
MEKRTQGSLVSSNSDTDTNTQQRRLAPNGSNEVFWCEPQTRGSLENGGARVLKEDFPASKVLRRPNCSEGKGGRRREKGGKLRPVDENWAGFQNHEMRKWKEPRMTLLGVFWASFGVEREEKREARHDEHKSKNNHRGRREGEGEKLDEKTPLVVGCPVGGSDGQRYSNDQ